MKNVLSRSIGIFIMMTIICGIIYTLLITGIAQMFFSDKANGSIIEINGKKYGSELLGQQFQDEGHLWGRIMNVDTQTFKNENGESAMWAFPSNISPASDEFKVLVEQRVENIKTLQGDQTAIPVELVTCSGSGLDPHISPKAAEFQVKRIANNTEYSEEEIRNIIKSCTEKKFLGLFGEDRVNVLKVNLILEGVLKG